MIDNILIVDDHPLYRDALQHVLRDLIECAEVISVGSAEEGLRLMTSPAGFCGIFLDFAMPGLNGAEAVLAFRKRWPQARIIVVSASESRQEANAALQAGANAFVSKALPLDALRDAVRRILCDPVIAPEWIRRNGTETIDDNATMKLTSRQKDVLTLLSAGHSNKEIALRLEIAEVSVKAHLSALFRILNVINRTQAVLAARKMGLCDERG